MPLLDDLQISYAAFNTSLGKDTATGVARAGYPLSADCAPDGEDKAAWEALLEHFNDPKDKDPSLPGHFAHGLDQHFRYHRPSAQNKQAFVQELADFIYAIHLQLLDERKPPLSPEKAERQLRRISHYFENQVDFLKNEELKQAYYGRLNVCSRMDEFYNTVLPTSKKKLNDHDKFSSTQRYAYFTGLGDIYGEILELVTDPSTYTDDPNGSSRMDELTQLLKAYLSDPNAIQCLENFVFILNLNKDVISPAEWGAFLRALRLATSDLDPSRLNKIKNDDTNLSELIQKVSATRPKAGENYLYTLDPDLKSDKKSENTPKKTPTKAKLWAFGAVAVFLGFFLGLSVLGVLPFTQVVLPFLGFFGTWGVMALQLSMGLFEGTKWLATKFLPSVHEDDEHFLHVDELKETQQEHKQGLVLRHQPEPKPTGFFNLWKGVGKPEEEGTPPKSTPATPPTPATPA